MKMFRKLASVFLSLSVLAAIPQVKAEEIPEPTNDSEEIVPAEETSEPAVSEESSPEKTDQEETGTEVISETAEPEPTGTEEMVPQAPDQEAADQEEAETEVTEEEKEEADREPLAEAEEGSQAMEDGIVMPAEFVLPAGYSNPIPVTVTIPGKTAEDLVFTSTDGSVVWLSAEEGGEVIARAGLTGTATVDAFIMEGDVSIASASMNVTVENWIDSSADFMRFTEIGETQSLSVLTLGAAAESEITLGPPPEEKGDPIVEVTPAGANTYTVKALQKGKSEIWATVDNPNPEGIKDQKFEIKVTEVLVISDASIPKKIIIDPRDKIHLAAGRTEVVTLSFEPADADPLLIKCGVNPGSGQEGVVTVERDPFYPYRYFVTASETLQGSAWVYFQYTDGDVPSSQIEAEVSDPFVKLPESMDIPSGQRVRIPLESNLRELYEGGAEWTVSPDTDNVWFFQEEGNHIYVESGEPLDEPVTVSLSVTLEDSSVIEAGPMSVMAREWIHYEEIPGELFFVYAGDPSEAQEVTIPYFGPEELKEFKLVPPLEDKENPLVEATWLRMSEDGAVFSVKPLRTGHSVLFAEVKNPYCNTEPFHFWISGVTAVSKDTKPKKIIPEHSELEMEPGMLMRLHFSTDPESADPGTISVKSSNPNLVEAVKPDDDPFSVDLRANGEMEGSAVITLSAGSVKANCTVTVLRSIKTDKDAIPLLMGEDKGSLTVTLDGRGKGNEVKFQYLDSEYWEPIDPETAPFTVEEVSHEGDVYQYSVTPKFVGSAVIGFWYESETAFSETHTYVEVREMDPIVWRDDLIEELERRVFRNNEEVYLDTWGAVDPTIRYAITYYTNKEDAEADKTDPELLYEHHIYINSNFLGTTYAKLRAIAEKPGFRPSETLEAVLTIDNGDMGIWDQEHLDYINARGGLYAVHNELCVYGIPDAENGDEWEKQQVTYTGQLITFHDSLRVWYGTRYLEEGEDYKVSYANNKMPALSSDKKAPAVTITGIGDFKDKKTIPFTILKRNIADCEEYDIATAFLSFPESERDRTLFINNKSKAQTPRITLSLMSRKDGKSVKLADKKDYTLLYYPYTSDEHGIIPGNPVTEITEAGYYLIVPKAAGNSSSLIGDPEQMPPGGKLDYLRHMPGISVYNTDQVNVADISKAKFSKNLGTVTLKLNPEGYYSPEDIYQKFYGADPEIKVLIGKRQLVALERNIENNEPDFTVFMPYIRAGENFLNLYGLENYDKDDPAVVGTKTVKFNIAPFLKISSSTAKIEGLKEMVVLNSYDRFQLWKEGEDNPSSIAQGDNWDNVKLKDKAGMVIPSDYYDVQLSDYRRGTGTITVTFTGRPEHGYVGSISQKIKVEKANLEDLAEEGSVWIEFPRLDQENAIIAQAEFSQAGTRPEYRVVYRAAEGWTRELMEGTDFTVSWSDNKNLSSVSKKNAKLIVKGKGYFAGSMYREFEVVPADFDHMNWLNQLTVSCPDVVYNAKGKAGYFMLSPTVYDGTKKLTAGKDYRVIENGQMRYAENFIDETGRVLHVKDEMIRDTDNVPVGARIASDQRIEVLNSNYTYSRPEDDRWIHAEYRIVTKDMNISSATVIVNGKKPVTLGEDWSVVPPIEVSLKKVPLKPEDYVIESIENNWKIGTATMVLRGVGKYCGTKKVTFKIDKSSLINKKN